jgi:hypothetical protein
MRISFRVPSLIYSRSNVNDHRHEVRGISDSLATLSIRVRRTIRYVKFIPSELALSCLQPKDNSRIPLGARSQSRTQSRRPSIRVMQRREMQIRRALSGWQIRADVVCRRHSVRSDRSPKRSSSPSSDNSERSSPMSCNYPSIYSEIFSPFEYICQTRNARTRAATCRASLYLPLL